ncbi:alpha/beta hydrolase [Embleya sp. NPDC020886]|uniref:alpha/beta hydrolase n=1 Tax=Embleya sp. NPDC020886 TaxID=3363980 RepID=UPI003795C2C3
MPTSREREKVHFVSGGTRCAAWHYPGDNGACVIMAGGFAVTKEPGTDPFAKRFHEAGFGVLAFDYRRFGESGGQPRQVASIRGQLADWQAAIEFAGTLPGVDPARLAGWAFSVSGGHVLRVAARSPRPAGPGLAAVIAQTPNVDGPIVLRAAARYQTSLALLRLAGRGILDALGGAVGRPPLLVPLAGARGTVALLATPDAPEGDRALNPDNIHPDWQQAVAARSTLALGWYRPGRDAHRVRCPILIVVCDQDRTALAEPAVAVARRAPHAELLRVPGGHYAPFTSAHEQVVEAELAFLRGHLSKAVPTAADPAADFDPAAAEFAPAAADPRGRAR